MKIQKWLIYYKSLEVEKFVKKYFKTFTLLFLLLCSLNSVFKTCLMTDTTVYLINNSNYRKTVKESALN